MLNYPENKKDIPPVGLLNFSRKDQKVPKSYKSKDLDLYNSCYINASIQCLFRLEAFVENIFKFDEGKLLMATKNLINNMKKRKSCSIYEIKSVMGEINDIYNNDEQGDANVFISDFLSYLIEETHDTCSLNWKCLENDKIYFNHFYNKFIKRKRNSFLLDLFYGVLKKETYCNICNNTSIKFSSFNMLEIPIYEDYNVYKNKEPLKIYDLLKKFLSEKTNPNEKCLECGKPTNYKISINTIPKCLIIYFTRNYSNNIINKVNIDISLNLEGYILDKSLNTNSDYFYHLKGIIFYSYSKNVSHYYAACLINENNNRNWYYFNDNYYENDHQKLRIYDDENPIFLFYENEKNV